ncbi:MAG: Arm DNA-binding domain-containing protein [Pseudomonadota bacterium]
MALTDATIRGTKPKAKSYRLYDERGLYLEVTPSGSKLFRYKYRFKGKEKRLALGSLSRCVVMDCTGPP